MRGVSLAYNIYIANIVGAEIIGVFSLIMSIYTFAITFATSGIGIACTYITSEEFAKKNYENGFKAVKTCSSFSFMLGLFASFVIILFAPILSSNFLKSSVSTIPFYLIAIALPLIAISRLINGYFSSISKSYINALVQVFEVSIKIICSIFLLRIWYTRKFRSYLYFTNSI